MVKVLGVEGNRIKLSRKAVLREQRQKLGLPDPNAGGSGGGPAGDMAASEAPPPPRAPRPPRPAPPEERQPSSNASTIMIEGGEDFEDDDGPPAEEGEEINYNRADGVPVTTQGERRPAGPGGAGGGPGGQQRRRRRRGRCPGGAAAAEAAGVAGNRSFVFGNQAKEPDVKSGSFLLPRGSCRSRELMARALRGVFFMRPGWRFGPFVFGTSNAR